MHERADTHARRGSVCVCVRACARVCACVRARARRCFFLTMDGVSVLAWNTFNWSAFVNVSHN